MGVACWRFPDRTYSRSNPGGQRLLVILSKASVESEWCKKELAAALTRELKEKRIVVLPVLKEECAIPLFLPDKLYADFRTNFDDGLRAILESVARITSETLTRVDDAPDWHTDWALDWGTYLEGSAMSLTAVEHGVGQPYCVLTEILVRANAPAPRDIKPLKPLISAGSSALPLSTFFAALPSSRISGSN